GADTLCGRSPRRHRVLELPPEQAGVEARRGVGVRLGSVDPARHPCDVTVALRQDSYFCSLLSPSARSIASSLPLPLLPSAGKSQTRVGTRPDLPLQRPLSPVT